MELTKDYFFRTLSKKNIANHNSQYIRIIGERNIKIYGKEYCKRLSRRADRIINCLSYWEWDKYFENKILDLKRVFRCRDLYCPNCRGWNSAKQIIRFSPAFRDLIMSGLNPYFLTLTIPNIRGVELGIEIDRLNKSFYKLWNWLSIKSNKRKGFKNRLFTCEAAIRVIELTVNKETLDFHIHIHAIVFLRDDDLDMFIKKVDGGYRYKSKEFINYSDADIFIQKLWTMAYKDLNVRDFESRFDDWQDNYICDIRELNLEKGIYEIFKYCFKDMQIENIEVFENIFKGFENRRLRQGYGKLFGIFADLDDIKDEFGSLIRDYLEFEEEPERLIVNCITDMVKVYNDYKKISRFKGEEEYLKIRD